MTGRSKEETENITLLGNQKIKYPDDYARTFWKHS